MSCDPGAFCEKLGGGLYPALLASSELGSGGTGPGAGTLALGLSESLTGNGGGFTWPEAAVPSGPEKE